MNKAHYQNRMDKIMGFTYKHRTLRTLFDCYSHEWDETDINKKLMLLELLIDSGFALCEWIEGYKNYYEVELSNKKYVTNSINDSLVKLYQHASQDLRFKVFNGIVPKTLVTEAYPILNDLQVTMVIAKRMYG